MINNKRLKIIKMLIVLKMCFQGQYARINEKIKINMLIYKPFKKITK